MTSRRTLVTVGPAILAMLIAPLPGAAQSAPPEPAADPGVGTTTLSVELIEDAGLQDLLTRSSLGHIASGEGGLVALAECDDGPCTVVTRSDDGRRWETIPGILAGVPVDIAASDAGFVVLASDGRREVAYLSDDGREWSRSTVSRGGLTSALSAGPDGFLAFGCDGRRCDTSAVWSSADGVAWERRAPEALQGHVVQEAVSSDGLTLAIGVPSQDVGSSVAFTLADGVWERLDLPLPGAGPGGIASFASLARLPGGGFAIVGEVAEPGEEVLGDPFLLTSPDGLSWDLDETVLDAVDEDVQLLREWLVGDGQTLVGSAYRLDLTGGSRGGDGRVVTWSADGREWQTVEMPQPNSVASLDDAAFTPDGHVVIVGSLAGRRADRPAAWLGTFDEGPGEDDAG